ERAAPLCTHDLWADDDVAQLARHAVGNFTKPVDGEGERVGRLVDAEVLPLQRSALVRPDEGESQFTCGHPFSGEHRLREPDRRGLVDLSAGTVRDLDLDHRLRCVPVCSACALYASTIRCTSLCRTTSWWLNSTNAMPSTVERMSRTWISPDACSRGRSTCVTSPVTTIFEPKPSRVGNICIWSGAGFWASCRMAKAS